MAKNEGGGGGGFGWLVLGVIIGVAGTLAFVNFTRKLDVDDPDAPQARTLAVAPAPQIPVVSATPPPSARVRAAPRVASGAPAAAQAPDASTASQVADDAAAAGMTSRATN
jgi:hypothetical protein